jgi:hypothetical protein
MVRKKRERREAGKPLHPWRENPSLSSRPPFEPGHELSLRHGAMSERKLQPIAEQLTEDLLEVAPWCDRPAFRPAVEAWAWSEAVCVKYRAWFAERGLSDEAGEPLPGLVRWDRAEARASALRKRLSIDPSSFASFLSRLATTSAITENVEGLAEVRREGRAIVQARERQLAGWDEEGEDGDE